MYITLLQLIDGLPGALELAQVASDEQGAQVDSDLLTAIARGADTDSWAPEDVAAAQRAVARVNAEIERAAERINRSIRQRYPSLPEGADDSLRPLARAIVRRYLHKDFHDEGSQIEREYRDALRDLTQIANGMQSIGEVSTAETLGPTFVTGDNPFARERRILL